MAYPASLIAYAFVKKAIDSGEPISQMKLQKLVYFAHGLHLAQYHEPLVKESVQAWKFGPVIPAVYNDYKFYGSQPISDLTYVEMFGSRAKECINDLDKNASEIINATWDNLREFDAIQLSDWTHKKDSPWSLHFKPFLNEITIPNDDIEKYFARFINKD